MQTINDMVNNDNKVLKNFYAFINSMQQDITTATRATRKTIEVKQHHTEFATTDGHDWECQHATVDDDVEEVYDHYMEAVSGLPQPIRYQPYQYCEDCEATKLPYESDWSY